MKEGNSGDSGKEKGKEKEEDEREEVNVRLFCLRVACGVCASCLCVAQRIVSPRLLSGFQSREVPIPSSFQAAGRLAFVHLSLPLKFRGSCSHGPGNLQVKLWAELFDRFKKMEA